MNTNETRSAPREAEPKRYLLRLYVAGQTPKSALAISNLKRICEENLQGQYELEVIDLYQQPQLAQGEQIIAVPTLIKKPPPVAPHHRRHVGYRARAGGAGFEEESVMPNQATSQEQYQSKVGCVCAPISSGAQAHPTTAGSRNGFPLNFQKL